TPVARPAQERALAFIEEQVFDAPLWILEPEILERFRVNGPERLQQRQATMVGSLLSAQRLGRMLTVETTHPQVAYPVNAYLDDLRAGIWGNAAQTSTDRYRRALQRAHVDRLVALFQ